MDKKTLLIAKWLMILLAIYQVIEFVMTYYGYVPELSEVRQDMLVITMVSLLAAFTTSELIAEKEKKAKEEQTELNEK